MSSDPRRLIATFEELGRVLLRSATDVAETEEISRTSARTGCEAIEELRGEVARVEHSVEELGHVVEQTMAAAHAAHAHAQGAHTAASRATFSARAAESSARQVELGWQGAVRRANERVEVCVHALQAAQFELQAAQAQLFQAQVEHRSASAALGDCQSKTRKDNQGNVYVPNCSGYARAEAAAAARADAARMHVFATERQVEQAQVALELAHALLATCKASLQQASALVLQATLNVGDAERALATSREALGLAERGQASALSAQHALPPLHAKNESARGSAEHARQVLERAVELSHHLSAEALAQQELDQRSRSELHHLGEEMLAFDAPDGALDL